MSLFSAIKKVLIGDSKKLGTTHDGANADTNKAIRITSAIAVAKLKERSEEAVTFCPWIEDASSSSIKLAQIEFFIFHCFVLDVLCHQHQTGDYARAYLTKHAESMLMKILPQGGNWNPESVARLYSMRVKLYEAGINNNEDWLGAGMRKLLTNAEASMHLGEMHLQPIALSNNPIQGFLHFQNLCNDMLGPGNIINPSYINSLALAIKNAPNQPSTE